MEQLAVLLLQELSKDSPEMQRLTNACSTVGRTAAAAATTLESWGCNKRACL